MKLIILCLQIAAAASPFSGQASSEGVVEAEGFRAGLAARKLISRFQQMDANCQPHLTDQLVELVRAVNDDPDCDVAAVHKIIPGLTATGDDGLAIPSNPGRMNRLLDIIKKDEWVLDAWFFGNPWLQSGRETPASAVLPGSDGPVPRAQVPFERLAGLASPEELLKLRLVNQNLRRSADRQLSRLLCSEAFLAGPDFGRIFDRRLYPNCWMSLLTKAINRTGWFVGRPGLAQDPVRGLLIAELASKIAEPVQSSLAGDSLSLFLCRTRSSKDDLATLPRYQAAIERHLVHPGRELGHCLKSHALVAAAILLPYLILVIMCAILFPNWGNPWWAALDLICSFLFE